MEIVIPEDIEISVDPDYIGRRERASPEITIFEDIRERTRVTHVAESG